MEKIKILIVEDHNLLRETWTVIINQDNRFAVIGNCGTGEAAIEFLNHALPDIIMMDINLPGISGYDATQQILKEYPNIKVLAISLHNSPQYAKEMMHIGAKGYISKNASTEELFSALIELSTGNKYLSVEIKDKIAESLFEEKVDEGDPLTEREMEVIDLLKNGFSSKEIASKLFVSAKTIQVHRYNILRKLDLKNTAALVQYINNKYPSIN